MVYSALTEAQTLRQFEADATEAVREGYEPLSRSWDGTTLTVTYQRNEVASAAASHDSDAQPAPEGRSDLVRGAFLALGLVVIAAAVVAVALLLGLAP